MTRLPLPFAGLSGAVLLAVVGVSMIATPAATPAPSQACHGHRTSVSPTGGRLWTVDHHGTYAAAPSQVGADGSIELKAPWWAAGPRGNMRRGPHGRLSVSGRRLDATATPLRARTREVAQEGFGGSGVWAVVLTFPTEGCWIVSGRVGRTQHAFRLRVTQAPQLPG